MKVLTFVLPYKGRIVQNIYWPDNAIEEMRAQLVGKPVFSSKNGRVLGHVSHVTHDKKIDSTQNEFLAHVNVEDWVVEALGEQTDIGVLLWEGPMTTTTVDNKTIPSVSSRCIAKGIVIPPQS